MERRGMPSSQIMWTWGLNDCQRNTPGRSCVVSLCACGCAAERERRRRGSQCNTSLWKQERKKTDRCALDETPNSGMEVCSAESWKKEVYFRNTCSLKTFSQSIKLEDQIRIKAPFVKKPSSHLAAHIVACDPMRSLSSELSPGACADLVTMTSDGFWMLHSGGYHVFHLFIKSLNISLTDFFNTFCWCGLKSQQCAVFTWGGKGGQNRGFFSAFLGIIVIEWQYKRN